MFSKGGPGFFELARQGLSSTQHGYDLLAPKFECTPFRTPDELVEAAVRAIGGAGEALDICCGTGAGMQRLRLICRERVVGIDFSRGMIEQARRNLETAPGTARIEFVEGDVLQMTFQSEFEAATCFGALGHIPEADELKFLRRVHTALKPRGRFVFLTTERPPVFSVASLFARTFNGVMHVRNFLIRPPFIMYYLNFTVPDICLKLEAVGFAVEVGPPIQGQIRVVIATKR
jgi:ubiquinone/menaquinone biosynthesis C-methylase UbiE